MGIMGELGVVTELALCKRIFFFFSLLNTLVSPSFLETTQYTHVTHSFQYTFPNMTVLFNSQFSFEFELSNGSSCANLGFSDPFPSKSLPLSSSTYYIQPGTTSRIFGRTLKTEKIKQTHLRLLTPLRRSQGFALKASMGPPGFTEQLNNSKLETLSEAEDGCDIFNDLKHRFLSFKKNKYMENVEHFEYLATAQAPKFMVIACADSRVCPSNILGFQPGEAFMIRNVANLVPPFESGPSETNAALEFAVNSLQVENILVIGHSCCGGIRTLMSMQDNDNASFIKSWVVVGKNARIKAEAAASNLSFDEQCRHCEKESVNNSLSNLLTYPWIEEKVAKEELSVHGGYYDFIDCSFEKWTLDYRRTKLEQNGRIAAKNKIFWC